MFRVTLHAQNDLAKFDLEKFRLAGDLLENHKAHTRRMCENVTFWYVLRTLWQFAHTRLVWPVCLQSEAAGALWQFASLRLV